MPGWASRVDDLPFDNWYLNNLEENYQRRKEQPLGFQVKKCRELGSRDVLILNTLDDTYGHSLYSLFNASFYLKCNELDLVILVQKNLRWMVPSGAAEIWTVDLPFGRSGQWNMWLARRIKEAVPNGRRVFLCRSFVQADSCDFQIEDYSKVPPFPLEEWNRRLDEPTVTFVWRKDRFWRPMLPQIVDNRYSRYLAPRLIRGMRNQLEIRWILRFAHASGGPYPSWILPSRGWTTSV